MGFMEAEKYVQPGENREKVKQLRALGYGATRIARDLDISRSLLRECYMDGYLPASEARFSGSAGRDPARIQLRIPYRSYDRLYLVCASAGSKAGIPVVSASFYRPCAGFAEFFEATNVPLATPWRGCLGLAAAGSSQMNAAGVALDTD